jgi:hypothetical protein
MAQEHSGGRRPSQCLIKTYCILPDIGNQSNAAALGEFLLYADDQFRTNPFSSGKFSH